MNFLQAASYFLREAVVGLARSLRVSLLAILTIAVSLFLSGMVLLVSKNLARTVHEWRAEARFVVYLAPEVDAAGRAALRARIERGRWTREPRGDHARSGADALRALLSEPRGARRRARRGARCRTRSRRFSKPFPAAEDARLRCLGRGTARPARGVAMVDADQDWISQVETLLAVIRGLGIALAAILLGASVFTIASVVRLTSFLYREEIAVMRLVGATEFYIRGPFYFEGILQGLLGGLIAAGALGAVPSDDRPQGRELDGRRRSSAPTSSVRSSSSRWSLFGAPRRLDRRRRLALPREPRSSRRLNPGSRHASAREQSHGQRKTPRNRDSAGSPSPDRGARHASPRRRSALRQGHHDHDAPVLLAPGLGVVRGDRARLLPRLSTAMRLPSIW